MAEADYAARKDYALGRELLDHPVDTDDAGGSDVGWPVGHCPVYDDAVHVDDGPDLCHDFS